MSVNVKVSMDKQTILAKFSEANNKALKIVQPQIVSDCNKYAPDDQHILKRSAETHSRVLEAFGNTELRLVWSTPYARYLYYGVLMVDPKTRSAYAREGVRKVLTGKPLKYSKGGKLWCQKAKEKHIKDWTTIYENALKRGMQK